MTPISRRDRGLPFLPLPHRSAHFGSWLGGVASLSGVLLLHAPAAIAHGVNVDYQFTEAVEIQVAFDTGEPMENAQVLIYTPDNPSEPWLKGETDDQGRFTFTPDRSQPGEWEVVFRQAGHGDIVRIPVSETTQVASLGGTTAIPTWQRVVMGGAVIWGFVGTALFFSRGK